MDGSRIDNIARDLARSGTRRRFVGALLGAFGASCGATTAAPG